MIEPVRPCCDDGCERCATTVAAGTWGSSPTVPSDPGDGSGSVTGPARSRPSTTPGGRLGAGLVEVPAVDYVDPTTVLLDDPSLPESRRFCGLCREPVGRRGPDGGPGPVEGICPNDDTPFSFRPTLEPGVVVAGQYEVHGCLAFGGLGWIYLAADHRVGDRWVVLKGLLDPADDGAVAAARAELRFLAQTRHPNIVEIHNFVTHPGRDGAPIGYIVMEYVGGRSLRQILDGHGGPLPVAHVVAYALEILPTLGYLHGEGLTYNDFKPENVIQYDRDLKLIDLGAVIWMDDPTSQVYVTPGYQAPEIRPTGPSSSPRSDVYTVGRTLAVLALGIASERDGVPTALPGPGEHPVLARYDSFDRLLRRATDPDPHRRFPGCDEMLDQLGGVLHDVLTIDDAEPRPRTSTVFGPPRGVVAADLLVGPAGPGRPDPVHVSSRLPDPLIATDHTSWGVLATGAMLVRAHLDGHDPRGAGAAISRIPAEELEGWRRDWFLGLVALADGRPDAARAAFDAVYSDLPGEEAARLALAASAEAAGDDALAAAHYAVLARRDPAGADAVFGLARVWLRAGHDAWHVLDSVPASSSHRLAAQLAAVRSTLLLGAGEHEVRRAAEKLAGLDVEASVVRRERANLLDAAITIARGRSRRPGPPPDLDVVDPLLEHPWCERDLRLSYERCLREVARSDVDAAEGARLIDLANRVRPRTWM